MREGQPTSLANYADVTFRPVCRSMVDGIKRLLVALDPGDSSLPSQPLAGVCIADARNVLMATLTVRLANTANSFMATRWVPQGLSLRYELSLGPLDLAPANHASYALADVTGSPCSVTSQCTFALET